MYPLLFYKPYSLFSLDNIKYYQGRIKTKWGSGRNIFCKEKALVIKKCVLNIKRYLLFTRELLDARSLGFGLVRAPSVNKFGTIKYD